VFKDLSSKTRLGVTAILRQFVEKVHWLDTLSFE
jgi:hypothetical protein